MNSASYDAVRALYDGAPGHPVVLGRARARRRRASSRATPARASCWPASASASGRRGTWRARPTSTRREELAPAVNLEQSFEVQAPIDAVWPALNDLEQVAPCLPGRRDHRP